MFELRSSILEAYDQALDHRHGHHAALLNQAIALFNRAMWKGRFERLRSHLLHRSCALLNLECIPRQAIRNQHYGGLHTISLEEICGSMGRTYDFDQRFHPRNERTRPLWVSVAIARRQDIPLDAVQLIQVGHCYFVQDGHHRISVAHALGEAAIEAEITIWEMNTSPCDSLQPILNNASEMPSQPAIKPS